MAGLEDVKSIQPNSGLVIEETRWEPSESIKAKEGAGGQYGDEGCQMSRLQLLLTSSSLSAQCLNIQVSRLDLGQALSQVGITHPYLKMQVRLVACAFVRDA